MKLLFMKVIIKLRKKKAINLPDWNKNREEFMKIGEVSKELDIPSATLRYYEQIGLLENIMVLENIKRKI